MLNFFDYFEYKNAPSIPGPTVDLETYQGISTSDMRTFVKYKPYDKWYSPHLQKYQEWFCKSYLYRGKVGL